MVNKTIQKNNKQDQAATNCFIGFRRVPTSNIVAMQLTAVLTAAFLAAAKGVEAVETTTKALSKNEANNIPNLRGADLVINGGDSGGVIASDGDDEEAGRRFDFDDEEFMEGFLMGINDADSEEYDYGDIEEVEGDLDNSQSFFENIVLEGCQNTIGGGCGPWPAKSCCSGKSCHSSFKCYHKPRHEGEPCSAFYPCDTENYYCSTSLKCQSLRTYGQSCDAVRKCDKRLDLECGDDFTCHNDPRQPGEKCGPAYPCVNTHYCSSPTASSNPNTCKSRRTFGQSCDAYAKCASGFECGLDSTCHNNPRHEGEACGPGATCGSGLSCMATMLRCIKTGSTEAISDVAELFKDDSVLASLLSPITDEVTAMVGGLLTDDVSTQDSVAVATAASACNTQLNDVASIDACFKDPVDDLVTRFTDFIGDTEAAIESKMEEISTYFQARLKYYQLAEYERLGIDPPQNLLDEGNIGFPGIMKVGVSVSGCYVVGLHAFAGFAFELWEVGGGGTGQRAGGFAGGGALAGACVGAGVDLNFGWAFTDDNIANAGGHTLGGAAEVSVGPGFGMGFAVDLAASSEGAPFPSIEISCGVGAGQEFKVGLVYAYEWADCFKGWNCEPCIEDGDPCVGDESIPAGKCCYPRSSRCEMGGNFGSPDSNSCTCTVYDECSSSVERDECSSWDKHVEYMIGNSPFTCSCMGDCPA